MKAPDGKTNPSWKDKVEQPPRFPPPPSIAHADVAVVGAGIAGLMTAHLLAKEGKFVIVLDEGPVASGQSERTSAHLTCAIDDRFYEIERLHGEEAARICYQSHAAAIELLERTAKEENIECEWARLDGLLFPLEGDPPDELDRELAAAKRAGFTCAEMLTDIRIAGRQRGRCIRFPNQARFHPLKFLYGLAQSLERRGVKIHTGCRIKQVQGADPKAKQPAKATIDDDAGSITAGDAIVVATNAPAPIPDWNGVYTKMAAYRTYIVAARVKKGAFEDVLYWDNADPYHYVRIDPRDDHDLLIIGGEDHKTGQMPEGESPFDKLEAWAKQQFPNLIERFVNRWSGQVQEPDDGIAFIGKAPTKGENVYVITGDSGMGLTHGALGARLVTDFILHRPNPWARLYDPFRKKLTKEFIAENVNALKQYARDYFTGGDVKSEAEIRPGQGAILREGLHKIACYRDDNGVAHKMNAACTHMSCIVQWNPAEKSWDCPCHGSRFSPTGKVVMGPAVSDLEKF
jgi:glycine/D-amino acid oxidase-like deaminating enzyme/nitrite reductase/ring-hydroxylating ferredoxin subunit